MYKLCERILSLIKNTLRLVVSDVANAEVLENFEECFAAVCKCNCTVVRISLLDENVTVESTHLVDREDTDTAEGTSRNIQNFAFCDVSTKSAFAIALESVEGDVACSDVAFKSTSGEVRLRINGLEKSVLNELILNSSVIAHLAFGSITAVEAHECVGESIVILALDVLVVDVLRNGVVNVEQGYGVAGDASADVF